MRVRMLDFFISFMYKVICIRTYVRMYAYVYTYVAIKLHNHSGTMHAYTECDHIISLVMSIQSYIRTTYVYT